jgi:NitT/TauT family transport system ATP-binding protein
MMSSPQFPVAPPSPPVVELEGVTKRFGEKTILKEIHYQIPDKPGVGELVALVGPSGCGKTTLLNLVAGLTQATEGVVKCLGTPVVKPGPDRAFVFQTHSEFPWRTVEDNVAMGLEFAGVPRRERLEQAHHWLTRVGLGDVGYRYPRELSGGMRQRLALARALTMKPRVILMDEPFGALDVRIRLDMQDLLREVWGETQCTVVMVTHDLGEAVYLADEVLVLAPDPGRLAASVSVPFGVRRTREIERSPEFRDLVDHITTLVRGVARKTEGG